MLLSLAAPEFCRKLADLRAAAQTLHEISIAISILLQYRKIGRLPDFNPTVAYSVIISGISRTQILR